MRGAKRQLWTPDAVWFWARVNKDGPIVEGMETPCWLWARWIGDKGYGMVRPSDGVSQRIFAVLMAHRVAWELTNGPIPTGKLVCHECDNRACVRPDHLFLGDDQANVDDMYAKDRGHKACGVDQHLAKLDDAAVRAIRIERARTPPTPLKDLAARFGVSLVAISLVARGRTWKHVTS